MELWSLHTNMLPDVYEHPKMEFESVLTSINFKRFDKKEILSRISFLSEKFDETARNQSDQNRAKLGDGSVTQYGCGEY